jgi:adenosylhomocysteine nucleosidase
MEASMTLAIVCGMASEAAIIGQPPGSVVIIGAGDAAALSAKLEAAIAAGTDRVISVGICGGLNPALKAGDIVVGVRVTYGLATLACDPDWGGRLLEALTTASLPFVTPAVFALSATAVARLADKALLRAMTAADCVDEESFIAGSIAAARGLPFAAMRVVCDPASFELPPAALIKLTAAGADDIGAILASIAGDPWQLASLVELAGLSATAMANLRAALARIGPNFGA